MLKKTIISILCAAFLGSTCRPVQAQEFSVAQLPAPGTMVGLSSPFAPLALKGLVVNPQKPLEFQFIVDTGRDPQNMEQVQGEATRLVKYFLAGLTIPESDLWVNLSPYEKERIVPEALGQTVLGRDLLAQDYILKQLTASLIYPEKGLGKEFWARVYRKAQEKFGTSDIPVNTFNKVWILPDQAQVFENVNTVYVTKSTLKVMLDEDYTARGKNQKTQASGVSSQIVREIILPEIEKEVNTGKNFATLRQIFQALILAKWYKETIKNSLLETLYTDKSKIAGVNLNDLAVKEQIYDRYLQAYKKGVFNYIKEEQSASGQTIPRKYFSGGTFLGEYTVGHDGKFADVKADGAMMSVLVRIKTALEQTITEKVTGLTRRASELIATGVTFVLLPSAAYADVLDTLKEFVPDSTKGILAAGAAVAAIPLAATVYFWARHTIHGILATSSYGEASGNLKRYLSKKDTNTLVALLKYPDETVRAVAVKLLEAKGSAEVDITVPAILDLLKGGRTDMEAAERALKILGATHDEMVHGYMEALLSKGSPAIIHAARRFGEMGDASVIPSLLAVLDSKEEIYHRKDVRFMIANALMKLGYPQSFALMVELLSERTNGISDLIGAFVELGDPRAIDPLLNYLRNFTSDSKSYHDVMKEVWRAAERLGAGDYDLFRLNLIKFSLPFPSSREEAQAALSGLRLSPNDQNRAFLWALSSKRIMLKKTGAMFLARTGGHEHADVFQRLLNRQPPNTQGDLFSFLDEAIRYKQEGYDFNVIYQPMITHQEEIGQHDYFGPQYETKVDQQEVLKIERGVRLGNGFARTGTDHALLALPPVPAAENGGIDLKQIDVEHSGRKIAVQFDPVELNELMQGGFEGFTPVIINVTPIRDTVHLLNGVR